MLMNVIKMIKAKLRTLCEGTDRGVAMDLRDWQGIRLTYAPFLKSYATQMFKTIIMHAYAICLAIVYDGCWPTNLL